MQNWVFKTTSDGLLIHFLHQVECKNNILSFIFRFVPISSDKLSKDKYKDLIKEFRQRLKDEFDIWPSKYDKAINKVHNLYPEVLDSIKYKLTDEQIGSIYALLRIKGYLSNKDEEQAFDFIL